MASTRFKKSDKSKTPVLFRMFQGEVLTLFPEDAGTDNWWTCSCYAHMGQHGTADLHGVVNTSRPARPAEYASLKKELERIGYRLVVKKRASASMDEKRKTLVRRS